jgi:predicted site-specific integrase-resolvase
MNNEIYLGGLEAAKALGVHQRTLYNWDEKGLIETIRTPGNKRLYNVKKFIENKKCKEQICTNLDELDKNEKLNLCYVRVSSNNQKDDLKRQKELMIQKYPNHLIIEEIGSGLNLNKKGIKKIIKLAIAGKINELVVAYRDRLTRFGFELIEELINDYSKGKIIVLNEKDKIEPEKELVKVVMSILNVYVAKMNGIRKYCLKEEK